MEDMGIGIYIIGTDLEDAFERSILSLDEDSARDNVKDLYEAGEDVTGFRIFYVQTTVAPSDFVEV